MATKKDSNKLCNTSLCPYKKREECPNVKENCKFPIDPNSEPETPKKSYAGWWIIFVSVLLIICCAVVEYCWDPSPFLKIVSSICISLLAGAIVAILIDLPGKYAMLTEMVATSLSSYKYLNTLNAKQLTMLRKRVTRQLHTKDSPNMPEGLLDLDDRICQCLSKPYYDIYREEVNYQGKGPYEKMKLNTDNGNTSTSVSNKQNGAIYHKKTTTLRYTLINPNSENHPATANIGINNHLHLIDHNAIEGIFRIDSFMLSIDGSAYVELKPHLKLLYHKHSAESNIDADHETYNTGFYITTDNNELIDYKFLTTILKGEDSAKNDTVAAPEELKQLIETPVLNVLFHKTAKVKFTCTRLLPEVDNHYTKRLKYATKSYRIDYQCEDNTTKLYGQLFGTLIDQSKMTISSSPDDKHLSIECNDWLLPRNGIIVVMSDKKPQKDNENNI